MEQSEIDRWLNGLREFDSHNRAAICAVLAVMGLPKDYLDVGCGSGAMVRTVRALGIPAIGIDRLPHQEDFFKQHDLGLPIDLAYKFELVTSIEVAEHIPAESADIYADTLARHVAPGGVLVLTAAPPGQPGDGHINCQPAEYWREKMTARGLTWSAPLTYRLALAWSVTQMAMGWLPANLQVFVNGVR